MSLEDSKLSLKNVIILVISAVSFTFSLTTIYWRFGQTEIEIMELREDVIYNKERTDRLRKRVEERVDILEEPNTDKKK